LETKPSSWKLESGVETAVMHSRAQWWLVITRPREETNDAEQLGSRTEARRMWSNHSLVGVNP
jgi:hypothetical protein